MSESPENLPEVPTRSHMEPEVQREVESMNIDFFGGGHHTPGRTDRNTLQSHLEGPTAASPTELARVPVEEQTLLQKTFDGTREMLSKASTQIPEENGLVYTGDDGVVEHRFNMEALVALNDMSVVRRACINALATNTVRLGYRIKKTVADSGEKESDRVSEQIIDLLEKCAEQDDSSFLDLLYKIKFDEETCGNGYLEVTRDLEGYLAGFHYVPGKTIWIKRDRSGFVQRIAGKEQSFYNFGDKWEVQEDGTRKLQENRDADISELIHFKLHDPNSNYYGVPRDIAAITTMYGDELARNHNTKFFTHSATPDLLLIFEVDKSMASGRGGAPGAQGPRVSIPEATKAAIENHFRRNLTSAAFTPGIFHLPPGVTLRIERLSQEQKDAGWTSYRKENRAEVQIAFQTPGVLIANTADGSNYATSMQEKSLYLESVVQPEQVRYQERLMAKIWPELTRVKAPETPDEVDAEGDVSRPERVDIKPAEGTGVNRHIWKLNFTRMSIADAATLAQIHNIYLTQGIITPNEVRAEIDKKSMKDGDKPHPLQGGAEGNALAQNADMKQVAAGNPDMDSFVSNMKPGLPHPEDITGLQGRPGGGRGPAGTVSLPMPRRVGDQSAPQAPNLFTAGQPIRKGAEEFDNVIMTREAYELLHAELAKVQEQLRGE